MTNPIEHRLISRQRARSHKRIVYCSLLAVVLVVIPGIWLIGWGRPNVGSFGVRGYVASADPWPGPGPGPNGAPPGGGAEFVPPNVPQVPNYNSGNSLPPLNQSGSVDINNPGPAQQAPAQAGQNSPAQSSGQPAHGQQPLTYDNAPGQIQKGSPQKPGEPPQRPLPQCNATWTGEAVVNIHPTPQGGILWAVKLLPLDAKYGDIEFETEIIINNVMKVNGYQPHIEPWYYLFHGSMTKTVQTIGNATPYTLQPGDTLHFLWIWTSVEHPPDGAMTEVQCTYWPS